MTNIRSQQNLSRDKQGHPNFTNFYRVQDLQHINKQIWKILKNICNGPQLIAKTNFAMRFTLLAIAFQEA